MTPLTATLTGSLGIKAGLGRDTLTLDLTAIPDDALTIAIKGDNGQGKSTILNLALTPWREPPQLVGTVYDQFSESGLRELTWTHGDATYRSRIEIRNTGKTKSQRAYLHQQTDTGWTPVALPDNTVSDGKASTYDACIASILGDQGVYYLSAFRAQNCAKLADHDDPKGLMRALLGLDEPARLADLSREVAKELRRAHESVRAQAAALDGHPARIAELETAIRDLGIGHAARVEAKLAALDTKAKASAELDRAMAGDLDRQRLIDQRAAAQRRLDAASQNAADTMAAARAAATAAMARVTAAQRTAAANLADLEAALDRANGRLAAAKATLQQRDAIAAAEAECTALAARIANQEGRVDTLTTRLNELRDLAAQVRTLEAEQASAMALGKQCAAKVTDIKARLADLNARAGFVALVPCGGTGQYAACPALQDAMTARERAAKTAQELPAYEAETEHQRAVWKSLNASIAALLAKTADTGAVTTDHATAATLLGTLRERLEAVRAVAAQGSALALAEQHMAEASLDADALAARMETARAESDAAIAQASADATSAEAAVAAAQENADATIAALRAELAALPEPGTDQAVTLARAAMASAEAAAEAAKAAIDEASATKAQHIAEIARLQVDLERNADTLAKARHLEAEISDWTLLGSALRGVIDLSIEDAGPAIAATTNRLLADAYGPRFAVRIVTQREQANGKTVETFDISVIDAESGLESSVRQKSGGESVWLDKALTDAVGLYHQEAAGVHFESLFADEAEDGLTEERKSQFWRMDRAALEMGGYRRKFFVSHHPRAWEYADHVIDLSQYRA